MLRNETWIVSSEHNPNIRSSPPEVFIGKGFLKIYSKFTGEHPCWSEISIKLQNNFIEIALRHECFPVNLLHIFTIRFPKNSSGGLLLKHEPFQSCVYDKYSKLQLEMRLYYNEKWHSDAGLFLWNFFIEHLRWLLLITGCYFQNWWYVFK